MPFDRLRGFALITGIKSYLQSTAIIHFLDPKIDIIAVARQQLEYACEEQNAHNDQDDTHDNFNDPHRSPVFPEDRGHPSNAPGSDEEGNRESRRVGVKT